MTNAPCLESLGTKSGRSGGNHPENVSELRELWKYVQQKINTEHGTIYQIFDWLVLKKNDYQNVHSIFAICPALRAGKLG